MGTLYLVATPIGNLEDITLRAIRILREVSLVAAEDTRTTRKLLSHHGITQRLISYNEHNMKARTPRLLIALDEGNVAFASEAGTPGVSDPGYELVTTAIEAGHVVVAVPGASALLAALTASGLPMREFTFIAFLPRRAGERKRLLEQFTTDPRTLVFFESPHRVMRSLADAQDILGDRRVAVCRELTKLYEEVFRGTLSEALTHFNEPRGEFTVVISGADAAANATNNPEARNTARKQLEALRDDQVRARDAVRTVVEATGLPHREVYALWLELRRNPNRR